MDSTGTVTNPNATGLILDGAAYPWHPQRGPLLPLGHGALEVVQSSPAMVLLAETAPQDELEALLARYRNVAQARVDPTIYVLTGVLQAFLSHGLSFFYADQHSALASQVRAFAGVHATRAQPVSLLLLEMRRGCKFLCDDGGDGSLDEEAKPLLRL